MLAYESSLAANQNCTSAQVLLHSGGDLPSSIFTDSQGPQTSMILIDIPCCRLTTPGAYCRWPSTSKHDGVSAHQSAPIGQHLASGLNQVLPYTLALLNSRGVLPLARQACIDST